MPKQPDGIKVPYPIPNDGELWLMDPGDLIPYENNPRDNAEAITVVRTSIERFGFRSPVEIDANNEIVAGHTRREAAIEEGATVIPVIKWKNMSGADSIAYRIAANKTGEAATWDMDLLSDQIGQLFEDGVSLEGIGFDDDELNALLKELNPTAPPEEPETPARPEVPFTKPGQLWELGDHLLYCGDAFGENGWLSEEPIQMVLTDPPYGDGLDIDYSKIKGKNTNMKGTKYDRMIGNDKPFDFKAFADIECDNQFWFGADYYAEQLPTGGSWFVWEKRPESLAEMIGNDFELIWSKTRHKKRIIRNHWAGFFAREAGETRTHPTQKPISLMSYFIEEFSEPGNIIFDPFMGSGSVLIAAESLGRRCYGYEIDPKYCDVIILRWQKYTAKKARLIE